MQAHLLALNDFNMPKVLDGADAMYTNLVYLILLEPGTFQSHPKMGVGLRSRYRDNNDSDWKQSLIRDIKYQIENFLPELINSEVKINSNDSILGIIINTQDGAYALAYNKNTNIMDVAASYVLDQL